MDVQSLLHPLLTTSSTATTATSEDDDAQKIITKYFSSTSAFILRILLITSIALISVWASLEASKGFEIAIVNDPTLSPAAQSFHLFYVSNDKVTRILLNASSFVENILYNVSPYDPNQTKKQVRRVTLSLAPNTTYMAQKVTVHATKSDDFLISLSPSVMAEADVQYAVVSALIRAVARIWVWDGESRAPPRLVNGMVEYIASAAGFGNHGRELPGLGGGCWDDKDPRSVAEFLDYCERKKRGFIQRLNQEMRREWDDRTVDIALRTRAHRMCDAYKKSYGMTR
ncbi:uncharacterized protein LOC110815086 [Carica papaya]|uniref:uncharacterized protein LOC110815086 n=1 Tax=Carica papaya TaxID=3649 RepID=UPI000B8D008B|nr:uncharacterized protein LOC110815086 [Carica papaya]